MVSTGAITTGAIVGGHGVFVTANTLVNIFNKSSGSSGSSGGSSPQTGNPFKGKTPQEIDKMFNDKGFQPRGPDPINGKGGYVNPKSGRSYHIDPGGKYKKGVEKPHVDVNRPRGSKKAKKKLFL